VQSGRRAQGQNGINGDSPYGEPVYAGFELELAGAERYDRSEPAEVNTCYRVLLSTGIRSKVTQMRPVAFGQVLPAGIRLTFSLTTSPTAPLPLSNSGWMKPRALRSHSRPAFPTYQVEDEEGRTNLLIYLAIEEQHEHRLCLWRPDQAGFDSKSIFHGALVEE
jgi:hypothetical protein